MWKQMKVLLVILSVAMNLAFVGVWLVYATTFHAESQEMRCEPGSSDTVWCPLHRELNVTAEQWRHIEPRLRQFRTSADEICRQIGQLRKDILDQLAAPETDLASVTAKQKEILANQRQMQELVIAQLTDEKAVLTSAQQRRLFDMLRSRSGCGRGGPMLVPGRGHEGSFGRPFRSGSQD